MIDFGCKEFRTEDIIKCGLSLTKAEYKIFLFLFESKESELTTAQIASEMKLSLPAVQRAVKKMHERGILKRMQVNLHSGYTYVYSICSRKKIREVLYGIIDSWTENVKGRIDKI